MARNTLFSDIHAAPVAVSAPVAARAGQPIAAPIAYAVFADDDLYVFATAEEQARFAAEAWKRGRNVSLFESRVVTIEDAIADL